jgi:hypothetical protein
MLDIKTSATCGQWGDIVVQVMAVEICAFPGGVLLQTATWVDTYQVAVDLAALRDQVLETMVPI